MTSDIPAALVPRRGGGVVVVGGTSQITGDPANPSLPGGFALAALSSGPVSGAFGQRFGPPSGPVLRLVNGFYLDFLGRDADSFGQTAYGTQLFQGTLSRQQVAADLIASPEARLHALRGLYRDLLGREIDAVGQQAWLGFLLGGGTLEQVEAFVLGSPEYFLRAGGRNDTFLAAVYQDVLQRPVDATGAAVFGQALAAGTSRTQAAALILNSPEADAVTVTDLYAGLLGRAPDAAGLNTFVAALQGGATWEQVTSLMAGSPEYARRNGADLNRLFTAQVFRDLLGREIDSAGLDAFTAQLDGGTLSRARLTQFVLASPEYRTRVIQEMFRDLLGRDADPAAVQAGLGFLAGGGTTEQLEAAVLSSDEYFRTRGGGTNAGFLAALYQDVLGRGVDAAAAQTFGAALAAGTPRSAVVGTVLASVEADRIEVQELYAALLGRPADPTGLGGLVAALQAGATREAAIGAVVGSLEYTTFL
jgi:hypothetical protein